MAQSKKILVAFDPKQPDKRSSNFLVPVKINEGSFAFLGSNSGKLVSYGLVVLTSKNVIENDLFAKLVDIGHKISNVEECLANLEVFLEEIKSTRIGNIVELVENVGTPKLRVISNTPAGFHES
ncbi:hypothetical protein [Gimesia sp.]|uniref:hypothetical protein n=1 Tax=Gimesia sp. TaxID=2024833 RepID=UPI003A8CE2CE